MKQFFFSLLRYSLYLTAFIVLFFACQSQETVTPVAPPTSTTPVPAAQIGIDISNRQTVIDAYHAEFSQPLPVIGWVGNLTNCQEGTASATFINAQLSRVNFYRDMAGIEGKIVYMDSLNRKAQKAALIMASANTLSHTPPSSWKCYSTEGAQAAGKSNLSINYGASSDFISQYIQDNGENNGSVGHRRWILSPRVTTMGTGNIFNASTNASYNSLWVISNNYFSTPRRQTRDEFVAWPAPGYVPYQLIYSRWSFHVDGADFSEAQITIKQNGQVSSPAPVSRKDNGYGENAIVWEMPTISKPLTDVTYDVTVQQVKINNQTRTFTYKVIPIDPK